MIEAAICDGDIVTVRKADSADHGDIVAAMLRRISRIPGDDAVILGTVVAVLRAL